MWQDADIPQQTGVSFMEDAAAAPDWPWMRATGKGLLANGFWGVCSIDYTEGEHL